MYDITWEHHFVDDAVLQILDSRPAVKLRFDFEDAGVKPFIVLREYECRKGVPMFAGNGSFYRPLQGPQREDL